MELVDSFDFVQIADGDSREVILTNIQEGLKEVALARDGLLETTPAEDFLNDLQD